MSIPKSISPQLNYTVEGKVQGVPVGQYASMAGDLGINSCEFQLPVDDGFRLLVTHLALEFHSWLHALLLHLLL